MKMKFWKKCTAIAVSMFCLFALLASCTADEKSGVVTSESEGTSTAPEKVEEIELYISAAASMTEALNSIKKMYEAENTSVTLIMNFASSGTLQKQIEEGAPSDLFISAAQKQMDALEDAGLLLDGSRLNLLENKVVLIVPKDSGIGLTSFEGAAGAAVSLIAIGDPESVPVGQYAQEIFTNLGIWDKISAKANLGSDVKAVLSWVETGNVDCGVVYATDAATSDGIDVVCEAPKDSHSPVVYPAAVVKASENSDAAAKFLEYLQSDEAAAVFAENGFAIAD